MVSISKTVRLNDPEMIYLQEKSKAEFANASDVIRSCMDYFYGNEDYFPKELMRVDDERSEAGRITIRLDEDTYNQIMEKSKIY